MIILAHSQKAPHSTQLSPLEWVIQLGEGGPTSHIRSETDTPQVNPSALVLATVEHWTCRSGRSAGCSMSAHSVPTLKFLIVM